MNIKDKSLARAVALLLPLGLCLTGRQKAPITQKMRFTKQEPILQVPAAMAARRCQARHGSNPVATGRLISPVATGRLISANLRTM